VVERLTDVDGAATKMSAMIDDLLDLARLDSGRELDLEHQATDLVALARTCVAEHQSRSRRHRMAVDAAVPELVGWWDAGRLERALSNLLANAVKYSPDGGAVTVTVARQADPDAPAATAVLRVRDDGIGIPAADLPYVFERFYRGGNVVGRISGSGIGLAGAKQIIEQQGGTMRVESTEGLGTTVTVYLPITEPITEATEE
jgi:signal transduction histidine kinase